MDGSNLIIKNVSADVNIENQHALNRYNFFS